MARVLAAMSGGVDSAVAAAVLVEQGHDVTGVHVKLADVAAEQQVPGHGCCTLDDAQDARRTAQVIGIPFYVWDLSELFRAEVEEPFVAAYATGTTPNPCVACNERVKYRALLDRARRLGFDALATGHHARLRRGPGTAPAGLTGPGIGAVRLFRATDRRKDQTYVLYMATAAELAHTLLPAGELTKDAIRAEAARRGLRVSAKPDSYDVCFIPRGDNAGYLAARIGARPGAIVDRDGRVLGAHDGVWRYTIGQRRGLRLGHHERRFVTAVDVARNQVVVGPRQALACHWVDVDGLGWIAGAPPATTDVSVQVRAHGRPVPARLDGDRLHLDEPVHGVACGQAAVVYSRDGDECLGGGRIVAADRAAAYG